MPALADDGADLIDVPLSPSLSERLQAVFNLPTPPGTLEEWVSGWLMNSCPTRPDDLVLQERTRHRVSSNGQTRYVWCALDAMILAILEGETLQLESSDPETGDVIEIAIAPTGFPKDGQAQRSTVLAFGFSLRGAEDLKRACCPYLNLFTSLAAYEKWCRKHPEALTVPLSLDQAGRLASRWARAIRPA